MVIDKQGRKKVDDEYGANYFIENFLGCSLVTSAKDETKTLINATEKWTRNNIIEDAAKAEKIRSTVRSILEKEESVNIDNLSDEILESIEEKEHFSNFIKRHGLEDDVTIDKDYVEKKLKKVRIKIDRDIDLYIDYESYKDNSKFGIVKNGDGSINIVLKNIINYIEK